MRLPFDEYAVAVRPFDQAQGGEPAEPQAHGLEPAEGEFQVPGFGFRIPTSNPSTRCACSGLASNIKPQTSNFKPSLV
jgi:hypothetical protein